MSDLLVYETSDTVFADRAIEALQAAHISCYRTGRGVRELNATIGRWTDDKVYIYIRNESDVRRANEILIGLGAAVDKPFKHPNPWAVFLVAAILVVLAVLAAKM